MDRSEIIESAPGRELLEDVWSGSFDALKKFYDIRKTWSRGYPFIHDRLVTYDFVDDMVVDFGKCVSLVPAMTKIALDEMDEYFLCALSMLSSLMPDDRILKRPEGFGAQLLSLKRRSEQLSFMPNMESIWAGVATRSRCLKPAKPDEAYLTVNELLIDSEAYLEFFPFPFPNLGSDAEQKCPIDPAAILAEGNKTCHAGVECRFEVSAVIEDSKWWIFRCYPKVSGFIWIGYVYVRCEGGGKASLGHWTNHSVPITQEELHKKLLCLEYAPWEREDCELEQFPGLGEIDI